MRAAAAHAHHGDAHAVKKSDGQQGEVPVQAAEHESADDASYPLARLECDNLSRGRCDV